MIKRFGKLKFPTPALAALLAAMFFGSVGCQRSDPLGPVADATEVTRIRQAISTAGGGGGAAQAAATGSGWATLKGRFVFEGTPVKMDPYNVTSDQATCMAGGQKPLQESLIVDESSKGLKNVAIYLRKASRVHESAQKPAEDKVLFDQEKCIFLTHVFPITLGQTMDIKNSDPVGHNTKISGSNVFNQTIEAGKTVPFTPVKEEAVPRAVNCSIHPWMVAYLLPRKNGYYAVTGLDGSFEINNLPAGETLEMQVWHERGTGNDGVLVLDTPQAKEMKWSSKGRFKLKLAEDEVKEIEITVPGSAVGS